MKPTFGRWSDYEDDFVFEYTPAEVHEMLEERGLVLPHLRGGAQQAMAPDAAYAEEEEEAVDRLTEHGLSIGRTRRGRGGLPARLREWPDDVADIMGQGGAQNNTEKT